MTFNAKGEIRGVQRVGLIKFKLENQPEIHLQLERVLGWAGAEFLVRLEREPLTLTVAPNLVGEEEGVDGSMWKLVASGDAGQRGIWRCRHWRGGTV